MRAFARIQRMKATDVVDVATLDPTLPMREADLHAELLRPWSRAWVAHEDGGEVVAFLLGWHVADEVHILNLVTRADQRRRGIGRAMMTEVFAYAFRAQATRALLEVRRSNRAAIGLYRALGFFAFGVRARYYPDDEDAVEMAATLNPVTGQIEPHPDEVTLDA